jgi:hypothetical protein
MLRAVVQTAEVLDVLISAGVPAVTVKGPALAQLLFDDPIVRGIGDVDIVVSPEHAVAAEHLLRGIGYERSYLWVESTADLPVRNPLAKAVSLRRAGAAVVDLQWRLLPSYRLRAPSIVPDVQAPEEVDIAGVSLWTLPITAHLRFASAHAIVHEWARFKWLVDFGVIDRRLGTERHLALAVDNGAGRQTAAGLDALDVIVGVAPAALLGPAARRAVERMARPVDDPGRRGSLWRYQVATADRLADKARVLARFGLRLVPGMLPVPPPPPLRVSAPAEPDPLRSFQATGGERP